MKLLAVLLFLGISLGIQAQEVEFNGATYKIKGETILKDNADVTSTMSIEEKTKILETLKEQKTLEAKSKKYEKSQVKVEKKQKKLERTLKKKEKAQSNFEKSSRKYDKAVAKYESLKKRGRLSPVKEAKWIEKVEKLKYKKGKFESKLK